MRPDVRDLTQADGPALSAFFAEMPAEDRTFFQFDVDDPAVIDAYVSDDKRLRKAVVDDDGRLRALAALDPGLGWSAHVADLVLLVSPRARRQGLGKVLARTMLIEAVNHGYKKVTVTIASDNESAVEMFLRLGFEGEALLRDQLRNPGDGELRDTVILAHLVDDTWSTMVTGGFEDAVA
ncbi:GNAT family N-acetyltransferase [Conexibacter sp. DBS9H8]|uniref:GNAT family N-acetyltransferase n=1 Tax=Conexibacter sp. DBS9H8 TaxID=2937801 RepID=UPI00200F60AC|nr:GNAT family N-acetyltransferase [Conexibacter sp. DBS9H8]